MALPRVMVVEAKNKSLSSVASCRSRTDHAQLLSVRLNKCKDMWKAQLVCSRSWTTRSSCEVILLFDSYMAYKRHGYTPNTESTKLTIKQISLAIFYTSHLYFSIFCQCNIQLVFVAIFKTKKLCTTLLMTIFSYTCCLFKIVVCNISKCLFFLDILCET
jgi:hypothetical protein